MRPDYRRLAASLGELLDFDSIVDVGCANAFLLEAFGEGGKEIAGIELSPAALEVLDPHIRDAVQIGDFAELRGTYDLVCCVEVAEHIPPERSLDLVATITGAARKWIYFTAAPPGQGGHGHINCRPHEEWIAELSAQGWVVDQERTDALRSDLERLQRATWLRGNSFILGPSVG